MGSIDGTRGGFGVADLILLFDVEFIFYTEKNSKQNQLPTVKEKLVGLLLNKKMKRSVSPNS